jgi:hypothetical protein
LKTPLPTSFTATFAATTNYSASTASATA